MVTGPVAWLPPKREFRRAVWCYWFHVPKFPYYTPHNHFGALILKNQAKTHTMCIYFAVTWNDHETEVILPTFCWFCDLDSHMICSVPRLKNVTNQNENMICNRIGYLASCRGSTQSLTNRLGTQGGGRGLRLGCLFLWLSLHGRFGLVLGIAWWLWLSQYHFFEMSITAFRDEAE